jgi:uncharacterized protein YndB with AHSA1/START domain
MRKLSFLFLTSLLIISCNPKASEEKNTQVTPSDDNKKDQQLADIPFDSVVNKSFVNSFGEKYLHLECIVNTSVEGVWWAFSNHEALKSWMAPVSQLNFRIGGIMKNNMDYRRKVGDKGTFTLDIVNYIPNEMLTYRVHLDNYFGEKCGREDKNLQEVIQFKSVGKNKTKIISNMIGWGEGAEWDKCYAFFTRGNKWCYDVMMKRFRERKPIDWPNDP